MSRQASTMPKRHDVPADRFLSHDPLATAGAGHSPKPARREGPPGALSSKASLRPGSGQEVIKRHAKGI